MSDTERREKFLRDVDDMAFAASRNDPARVDCRERIRTAYDALLAENAKLREEVRRLEWSVAEEDAPEENDLYLCPCCLGRRVEGHRPGCTLHAALTPEAPDA